MAAAFPKLYAILDAGFFRDGPDPMQSLLAFARELVAGGATLIQYRNKQGSAREALSQARELRRICGTAAPGCDLKLIMNDRADLCLAAGLNGVHLGQDDLSPGGARAVVGDRLWVGVSTHSVEQVREAENTRSFDSRVQRQDALAQDDMGNGVDYIAIGPVFATATKANPDPVIGLAGVRAARAVTRKPLVAIGGITRANCRAVLDAGADAVAVVSDLRKDPRKAVEEFLRLL
jgi:thiamine-phosphate pyrophosphorylase